MIANVVLLLRKLGPLDVRNIRRDPLLVWVALLPPALALIYGLLVPRLRELLLHEFQFDLAPFYPLIMSTFVTAAPGMIGMVIGFLLLDERDDGVLTAIGVTAVGPADYLAYRLSVPMIAGWLMTVACYPLAGLAPLPLVDLVAIAAVAALSAPIVALFLATFAENKVSGFAMVKVSNTINMAPVAAWFFDPPLQWIVGIVPAYWPMKMLWLAAERERYAAYAAAGVAVNILVMLWFMRRFRHRIDRASS
ncbi:MAG: ABC transporter [Thermoanaerobaculia bacterium]